jgi:hypothetical protein
MAGYLADLQGSYRMTFIVISFIVMVGAVLIFMAPPPETSPSSRIVIADE